MEDEHLSTPLPEAVNIWQLHITEIAGIMIETSGRTRANRLLKNGWILLHIYTLSYKEDGIWRQRPMAILGRPLRAIAKKISEEEKAA